MPKKEGNLDLIELKSGADNPLYAAIEILKHGVLYLFFVSNLKRLSFRPQSTTDADPWELVEAEEIALCVLAPKNFYDGFSLPWLEDELNQGLRSLQRDISPRFLRKIQFRFEWYPDPPFYPKGGGFIFNFTRTPYEWSPSKQAAD